MFFAALGQGLQSLRNKELYLGGFGRPSLRPPIVFFCCEGADSGPSKTRLRYRLPLLLEVHLYGLSDSLSHHGVLGLCSLVVEGAPETPTAGQI